MFNKAAIWIAALWWGSLTTVGLGVVPMLFVHLPTPALAGNMAAKLFAAQTWVAVACATVLWAGLMRNQALAQTNRAHDAIVFVVIGAAVAMLMEFAVAPQIVARDNLRLWHTLGTGLYLLHWVCAGLVFKKFIASKAAW